MEVLERIFDRIDGVFAILSVGCRGPTPPCGMSANLCVQAHLHELLEQGYEVAVVRDATAAARLPEGDGYLAALINFRYIANDLWYTDDAVVNIRNAK